MIEPTYFGYGGFDFSWGDHICGIFDQPRQQMEIMTNFIGHGLRASQRCVWVAPERSALQFRESLGAIGGDLRTLEASSQLVVVSEIEFYLESGLFEPERTIDLLRTLLADGQEHGYPTMRLATDVSWLRHGERIDPDLWEQFEYRQTEEMAGLPAVLVCQYDRRQVSGSIIVAAFRTHQIVLLGEEMHENPFYVAGAAGPAAREVM